MSQEIRKTHRVFMAWESTQEEKWLNRISESGWQLIKGGCFSQKFVKDDAHQYCIRLDYKKMPAGKEADRYIETFEEQGWEHLNSTFNNWHYFRKQIREGEPESAYEIYTDMESVQEMMNRWKRLAYGCSAALLILSIVYIYLYAVSGFMFYWISIGVFLIMLIWLLANTRKMNADRHME